MKKTQTVNQRNRIIRYTVFTNDAEGLAQLVAIVGTAAIVDYYQERYVARNSLLSTLDVIDKGEYKGDKVYPERDSDEVIEFDLTANFPKPGERKTKWGALKNFVEQAKELLKKGGHEETEDNVRKVATKLWKINEEQKKSVLAEALGLEEEEEEVGEPDEEEDEDEEEVEG